jgi:hypothetical protein
LVTPLFCFSSLSFSLLASNRKHGRLLEEGASGFLAGKVPVVDGDYVQCHEKSWSSFNELIKSNKCAKTSFGSSNWASVYLANTPQEAAALGLQFPGVDEVPALTDHCYIVWCHRCILLSLMPSSNTFLKYNSILNLCISLREEAILVDASPVWGNVNFSSS